MPGTNNTPTKPKKQSTTFWHIVTLVISLCIVLISAWIAYSPLLDTPSDVTRSRLSFLAAKGSFEANPQYWRTKRAYLEKKFGEELMERGYEAIPSLIREITPEMLISFAMDDLGLSLSSADTLTYFPKISGSSFILLLSKQENTLKPLPIVLSLEIAIHLTEKGTTISFQRLRRGTQELSPSQSFMYFGPELAQLKTLDNIAFQTGTCSQKN